MKSMFENMVTIIIMVVFLFILTTFSAVINVQVTGARTIHASAINQIQSSYYQVSVDEMNAHIQESYPGWYIEVEEINSVNSRKDYIVTLHYEIVIPIFNIRKVATLEGYAR